MFIWALIAACITMLIDYCIEPGEIFGFYRRWLMRHEGAWTKPLGMCPVCMGTWVAIINFAVLLINDALNVWMFLPFLGVNHVILRILVYINDER